mmetsp:Transcript_11778/g.21480  ORF Transcript_11778/g.21480 Transcript_11778/m.21480 type:complete len:239 (+) Transcript_11778:206-922(+)
MLRTLFSRFGASSGLVFKSSTGRGAVGMGTLLRRKMNEPFAVKFKALSTNAAPDAAKMLPEKYSSPAIWLHWLMGAGMVTCIATVKLCQWTPKEEPKKYGLTKGELMNIHKSTAVLVAAMFIPRLAVRLTSKAPAPPPGNTLEHLGGTLSHYFLYFTMFFLPGSGFAMGYFGGKGVPFFGLFTIPGATDDKKRPDVAKKAFINHKRVGQALTYFMPVHVGAVGYHAFKGHNILKRIMP